MYIYEIFLFFVFGAIWGSFLNVVIYRLPRNISIVLPRSHCPSCKKLVRWYENIPLLGYLILRGRCRHCHWRIPIRYLILELILGIVAVLLIPASYDRIELIRFLFYFSIAFLLLALLCIDYDFQILPNSLNFFLAILLGSYAIIYFPWYWWLFGALVGLLVPLSVVGTFYLITKKIGMGGGDIKLFAILGLFLGPLGVVYNIGYSCFLGSLIVGTWMLLSGRDRNKPFAFGPFIIIVAAVQIFVPDLFSQLYLF